jgi:hypothetical protein
MENVKMFQTTNQRILFFPAYHCLVGGFDPSKKYEFVSWDDDIPNIWKVIKAMLQSTKQLILYYQ